MSYPSFVPGIDPGISARDNVRVPTGKGAPSLGLRRRVWRKELLKYTG